MAKIKKLKVKETETDFGSSIPLGADAANVDMADGSNAETAIMARVTQEFDGEGDAETPASVDADSVSGYDITKLYSDFVKIEVPAADGEMNSSGLYFASVSWPGMTADKAILSIQMDYETSQDSLMTVAAYSWDFLETSTDMITFYGTTLWTSPFSIIGIIVQAEEGEY